MASSRDRDAWSHIFKLYKGLPHLWNKRHKSYGNRSMMTDGYKILTCAYRDKLDRQATVDTLRMKMKNLRTTYYRELRKVKEAKKKGIIYSPTLWYFENMKFLSNTSMKTIANTTENKIIENPIQIKKLISEEHSQFPLDDSYNEIIPSHTSRIETTKRTKSFYEIKPSFLIEEEKNLSDSQQNSQTNDDHWEVIGKSIGYQLRDLSTKQFTVVSKLISDAIFYGRLDKLSEASHIEVGPPTYAASISNNNIFTLSGHYNTGYHETGVNMKQEPNIIVKTEEFLDDED